MKRSLDGGHELAMNKADGERFGRIKRVGVHLMTLKDAVGPIPHDLDEWALDNPWTRLDVCSRCEKQYARGNRDPAMVQTALLRSLEHLKVYVRSPKNEPLVRRDLMLNALVHGGWPL